MVQTLVQTMKAIAIDQFGGPETLKIQEFRTPEPKPYEVLIQVAYAGVNPVDSKIRDGRFKELLPYQLPLIPGWDVSGKVVAIGSQVTNLKVGDAVMAYCRKPLVQWGGYAEYMTFHAIHTVKKPANLSFAQAASIPLAALTAWQALFDAAHLRRGQTALIQAGAGGVGSFAIQFAKHLGAHVLATAQERNHDYLRELGVDQPLDYTAGDLSAQVRQAAPYGVDFVFDLLGGQAMRTAMSWIKAGGYLATIVEPFDHKAAVSADIYGGYVFVRPDGWQLHTIAELIQKGEIKSPHLAVLSLAEAAQAQQQVSSGHTVGKIVLRVGGDL